MQVPAGQVIVNQDDLRKLHDRIYRLESAVEDVQADLEGKPSAAAYRAAFDHLFDAAGDLVGIVIEPVRE